MREDSSRSSSGHGGALGAAGPGPGSAAGGYRPDRMSRRRTAVAPPPGGRGAGGLGTAAGITLGVHHRAAPGGTGTSSLPGSSAVPSPAGARRPCAMPPVISQAYTAAKPTSPGGAGCRSAGRRPLAVDVGVLRFADQFGKCVLGVDPPPLHQHAPAWSIAARESSAWASCPARRSASAYRRALAIAAHAAVTYSAAPRRRPRPQGRRRPGRTVRGLAQPRHLHRLPVRDHPGRGVAPRPRRHRARVRRPGRRPAGSPALRLFLRRTRPGLPTPPSATTCSVLPGPWPASPIPGPGAPPCAATSSASLPESPRRGRGHLLAPA
jgi:hypothetical protein